jgi:hypothetical protein
MSVETTMLATLRTTKTDPGSLPQSRWQTRASEQPTMDTAFDNIEERLRAHYHDINDSRTISSPIHM